MMTGTGDMGREALKTEAQDIVHTHTLTHCGLYFLNDQRNKAQRYHSEGAFP